MTAADVWLVEIVLDTGLHYQSEDLAALDHRRERELRAEALG